MKKIEKIENTYEEEVELQELSFSLSLFVKMPSSNNLTGKALVQIMVTVNGFFREPARPALLLVIITFGLLEWPLNGARFPSPAPSAPRILGPARSSAAGDGPGHARMACAGGTR
jgi:hypothetical protein